MTNTINNINMATVKANDVLHVWVGYGKNERFYDASFVKGDALNQYIEETVKRARKIGKNKQLIFIENMERTTAITVSENMYGIDAYTLNGVKTIKIK